MASSGKLACLVLLSLLFFQTHARESNFFSKVPNTVEKFEPKETQIPNKETKEEQEPNFIPQTQDTAYGLYGHESGQLPPSATKFTDPTTVTTNFNYDSYKTNIPYKPESEEYYNTNNNNNNGFQNGNTNNNDFQNGYSSNNNDFQKGKSKLYANSFYYNKDLYETRPQNFGDARLSRDDFTTTPLYHQENNHYNGGDNGEHHGMSDTRFLENGKYFYDASNEPRHYRPPHWNNNRGYYGNSGNNFEYGNSMEGYQNEEAEFQEEPTDFLP